MSSVHKAMSLIRLPGKVMPQQMLAHVLPKFGSGTGMAVAEKGTLSFKAYTDAASPQAVANVCAEYPDSPIIMVFADFPKGFKEDLIPPYHVLGSDDAPTLVCIPSGDFGSYAKENSDRSEAFFAYFTYIRPKLKKIEMQCGGDIDKVMVELKDPLVRQEILNPISGSGSIVFLSNTGKFDSFAKGLPCYGGDWGWISDPQGFKFEATQKSGETLISAVKKRFGSRIDDAEATPAAEPPKETPPPVPEKEDAVGPRTLVSDNPNDPIVLVKAPATLDTKNKRKDFYLAWLPFIPTGYKDSPTVQINLSQLRSKVDLEDLPSGIMLKPAASATATALPKTKDQEVARQHVSPTVDKVVTKPEEEEDEGDLTTSTKQEKIDVDLWMRKNEIGKTFKDNNQPLGMDPATVHELEKKIPKFTERNGVSGGLKAIVYALPSMLKKKQEEFGFENLIYSSPNEAANLMYEMGQALAHAWAAQEHKGSQHAAPEAATPPEKKKFGSRM